MIFGKSLDNQPEDGGWLPRGSNHVIREVEISAPQLSFLGGEGARDRVQAVADDVINHVYVIKPPLKKIFFKP